MRVIKIVDVEVGVDVKPEDVLEEMTDEDLLEHGLTRTNSEGGYNAVVGVFSALDDFHRKHHSAPSLRACVLEPCRDIRDAGMTLIDEARQSHWGRD